MPHLRVELQLPPQFWLTRVSRKFADRTLWVIALQRLRAGIAVAQVGGDGLPTDDVRAFLTKEPDVVDARLLDATRTESVIQVTYRHPVLVPILEATGFLPRYPFAVRSGTAYWEVLGVERASRPLIQVLESRLPGSRVRAVLSSHDAPIAARLTARQRAVLEQAMILGYYSFPRRITLTALARELGVDKGSLSVMLVRIEARMAEHWMDTAFTPRSWGPRPSPRPRSIKDRA
jgi:predicted DNA binding protein